MARAAALSIVILVSIALLLPLSVSLAYWGHHGSVASRHVKHHRHSRSWWRRHHARIRRMREARNRGYFFNKTRRSLDAFNNDASLSGDFAGVRSSSALSAQPNAKREDRQWRLNVPAGWNGTVAAAARQVKFYAYTSDRKEAGQAIFSLVPANTHSSGRSFGRAQRNTLAGVSFSDLRRIVIDRMIASGGWVVNDLEQSFGNRRAFVVLAQSPGSSDGRSREQAWAFYFMELDGRIYSLTTNTPLEFSDQMATESERLVASFHMEGLSSDQHSALR